MTAQYVADQFAAVMAEHGETVTLSRSGEATTISLKGKRIQGALDSIGGSADHQQFTVLISTTELLASSWSSKVPSSSTDTLTVGGRVRTVIDCRPMGDADVVAGYELVVVG